MEAKQYRNRWYAVWYENGKVKRQSLGTADRDEGRRRLEDFKVKIRQKLETVVQIVEAYIQDKATGPSAQTNRFAWKSLQSTFGHLRPDQITRDLSRSYTAMRRKAGRSDNTIHRELGVLNAALRWHDRMTPAIVELPPKPGPKTAYVQREDIPRLLAACVTPHIRLFVSIAYRTAARSEAILELTWDRVDLKRGMIILATGEHARKGRAVVPANESLLAELIEARQAARTDHVIEYADRPVASIKKAFARAAERAGMPWVTPHVLRHSAAVHMVEAGIDMSEVSQFLGHSSTRVTEKVYARFSPEHLRKAASVLN